MRRSVLHFLARWLPASEGFVYDLVTHVERPSVVVATRPLENTDRFPLRTVHSLAGLTRRTPAPIRQKVITARLMAMALAHGVCVVHAHHGYDSGTVIGMARRLRLPLVLSLHGDDVTGLLDDAPDLYERIAAFTSAVVVPSNFLVDYAARAGFDRAQIRVMPSGVDLELFTPTPLLDGRPEALFVGRFVEKKGLDVLAQAWPSVRQRVPQARLRLMGFGELEPMARSIPGDVEVVLAPTRRQVRDAMRAARVVVSPSHVAAGDAVESLLVVNLEAQASGRPLVTTDHGGIPEHVRAGETALVVPEGDPTALADAVVKVFEDDGLASAMANAGPQWAQRYDVRRTALAMDDLYDELVDGPAGR